MMEGKTQPIEMIFIWVLDLEEATWDSTRKVDEVKGEGRRKRKTGYISYD